MTKTEVSDDRDLWSPSTSTRPRYAQVPLDAPGVRARRELGIHWSYGCVNGAPVCCCGLVLDAPLAQAPGHLPRQGRAAVTAFVAEWPWQRYVALCQRCGWQTDAVRDAEEAHWLVAQHTRRCPERDTATRGAATGSGPLRTGDPTRVGPWRLYRRLGRGGTATTYLAHGDGSTPLVVVKVLRDAGDAESLARFRREVGVLRRLRTPAVPRLLDADVRADPPWLALELLTGGTLADRVRARGRLDAPSWWALASDLLGAVAALHDLDVVHRDIKPANAVLDERGARLVDLGAAVVGTSTRVTAAGSVVGTPGWMSPEQVQGGRITAATDLFSLGALLAYAGTGRAPFGAGTIAEVAVRVAAAEPVLERLDRPAAALVRALMAKDPQRRPIAREALERWSGHLAGMSHGGEAA